MDIDYFKKVGVEEATKETGATLYQLLNQAVKALYSAKESGRNGVEVYTLDPLEKNLHELDIDMKEMPGEITWHFLFPATKFFMLKYSYKLKSFEGYVC